MSGKKFDAIDIDRDEMVNYSVSKIIQSRVIDFSIRVTSNIYFSIQEQLLLFSFQTSVIEQFINNVTGMQEDRVNICKFNKSNMLATRV